MTLRFALAFAFVSLPSLASPPPTITSYTVVSWKEGCEKPAPPPTTPKEVRVEAGEGFVGPFKTVFTPAPPPAPPDARNLLAAFGAAEGDGPYEEESTMVGGAPGKCQLEKTKTRLTLTGDGLKLEIDTVGIELPLDTCTDADLVKHERELKCTEKVVVEAKRK